MLDIKFIREHRELIKQNVADRKVLVDVDLFLKLDEERRALISQVETLRSEKNKLSKSKPTDAEIKQSKKIGPQLTKAEKDLAELSPRWKQMWLAIPNLTHGDVKKSADDTDNPILETVGAPTKFSFKVKDHVQLAEELDLIDFERGAKVAGAKFYYLKNELALLSLALNRYALDIALKHDYKLFITPDLAKIDIIEGLGYNPRGESSQVYQIYGENLALIGTSEITLGAYHANEILKESSLPRRYVGLSHCFRTEAGSYSKFSKGIFRVHQFEKLEMFIYCQPEQAEKLQHELLKIEKEIFSGLNIPFRVIDHCTADLSTPANRTFDLEAWLPGKANTDGTMGDWAEITSTSNCTDYQARALDIKYLTKDGKKKLVHTLNGTANPGPRTLIAIMENYQTKDGSIEIPKKLRPYLPFKKIKK